ncbi:MAG TPA: rRNA maturation RNase YbeY [Gemmatimonadales bacterium]|nr:rRNA maturation RNase YbeY [Gemmatimonadales bacterium]
MAGSRRRGSPQPRAERFLARAARQVLAWERAHDTRVELTLLGAAAMRRLNRRATGRRGLTDVIAFTLPQPDGSTLGDVYLCPAATEPWVQDGVASRREELVRLVVHGTLHVLGYDHPAGPGRVRSTMWRTQERYVRRLLARSP